MRRARAKLAGKLAAKASSNQSRKGFAGKPKVKLLPREKRLEVELELCIRRELRAKKQAKKKANFDEN